jgi:molybdopterin molybdotransferase
MTNSKTEPVARPAPPRPLDDALADLLAHAEPLPDSQFISTFDADGRVLARDLVASLNVPANDNSAMDGYAVRVADCIAGVPLPVSQRVPAGVQVDGLQPLAAQTVARIFTGAPIPPGADAVVMQEDCVAEAGEGAVHASIRIQATPRPGQWIRRKGEDVKAGTVVLRRGDRLSPASLGLAASLGFGQVEVAPRVRVALFSTGDELVMPGEIAPADMLPGAIYNSNRFFLRALLQRLGCEVTDLGIVPDKFDATVAAIAAAAQHHDLILTSGGVSVGEEDHVKPAVQKLGRLDLWQIAIKPGKPFAYGRVGEAHVIGLPGNPVSSFVTFMLLVRPFILRLSGATDVAMVSIAAPAHFDWARADKRREFLRVRQNAAGGLDLFDNQSSGVLTSTVWGTGLVDNPAGRCIAHGDLVQFISFASLLA